MMKNILMYYYDFENPIIYKKNNIIHINDGNKNYELHQIYKKEEIEELYGIIMRNFLNDKYDNIKITKDNNLVLTYLSKEYVMIEINRRRTKTSILEDKKIEIQNINDKKISLDRSNWYFLWCKKNDYHVNQYQYIAGKNKIVDECFDYYIGLAENAILYFKIIAPQQENKKKYLVNRRISEENINNPLNLVIDIKERDISEYIKYLFFDGKLNDQILNSIINKIKAEKYSCNKIYCRLLYPTYFFDLLEEIDSSGNFDKKIKLIIKKSRKYEELLKNLYEKMNNIEKIKKIDWL